MITNIVQWNGRLFLPLAARLNDQIGPGRKFHVFALACKHSSCTDGRADARTDCRALASAKYATDQGPSTRTSTDFHGVAFLQGLRLHFSFFIDFAGII